MRKSCLIVFGVIIASVGSILAQEPNQDQSIHKRLIELLRHPTFITLRLSTPNYPSREKPTDAPAPYYEKAFIDFQLFMTQNSSDSLTIWTARDPYYQCRPELMRDGEIVPYTKEGQERVKIAETQPDNGGGKPLELKPGREYQMFDVNLDHWYGPLQPGRYQLVVRKRFVWDGDWIQSNPVIFEVLPRKAPESLPDNVTIRLAPPGLQPQANEKLHRFDSDARVAIFVVNNSDKRVRFNVIDIYYRNRFQLFKDNALIPYRKEIADFVRAKDENPYRLETAPDIFVDPNTTSVLMEVRLSEWYGPLAPGQYRLTSRQRFEINGPWTAESAPLLFEVVAQ